VWCSTHLARRSRSARTGGALPGEAARAGSPPQWLATRQSDRLGRSRWRRRHRTSALCHASLRTLRKVVRPQSPHRAPPRSGTRSNRAHHGRVAPPPAGAPTAAADDGAAAPRPPDGDRHHRWVAGSGASRRAMPAEYGTLATADEWYRLRCATGRWPRLPRHWLRQANKSPCRECHWDTQTVRVACDAAVRAMHRLAVG
jgi:hypothetical protein